MRWPGHRRRARLALLRQMANEQASIVALLIDERTELIKAGRADPLPPDPGIEARIEGGWVTMRRLKDLGG